MCFACFHFHVKFMSDLMWISTCLVASFRSCVLSWFFLWHVVWLSIMQLRHYLFIGTLNPMLNRLANSDPSLGNSSCHWPSLSNKRTWQSFFTLPACSLLPTFPSPLRLPQWVSTPMPSPWPSCVGCCALPGTDSSWTDTRGSLWLLVNQWPGL